MGNRSNVGRGVHGNGDRTGEAKGEWSQDDVLEPDDKDRPVEDGGVVDEWASAPEARWASFAQTTAAVLLLIVVGVFGYTVIAGNEKAIDALVQMVLIIGGAAAGYLFGRRGGPPGTGGFHRRGGVSKKVRE